MTPDGGCPAPDWPSVSEPNNERVVFLSTDIAGRREARLALVAVLLSSLVFAAAAPFAKTQLGQIPAFIPIYTSAFVICDVITAVLLFSQFNILRARALLFLAGGYLFTASMTLSYTAMFPGLFSPTGLLGAGPESTSTMYMLWHGGFPVAVIGYAILKGARVETEGESDPPQAGAFTAIFCCVATVLAVVCGFTLFVTIAHRCLPVFIEGDRTTTLGRSVLSAVWMLSLLALVVLWRRRPHVVIDLWLMVVTCVWLFDIALSAILNTGRYDLGWYVGRAYGLLAAGFLLVALLIENGKYYAWLVLTSKRLRIANQALERLSYSDGLTNIANRRFFDSYIANQIAIARRNNRNLALILCDIDSFKAYNDHYGHQAGDECLKQIAGALKSCCRRPADVVARFGGEEFAMILPDTDLNGAAFVAEAARAAIAQLTIPHEHSVSGGYVSISGGVSVISQGSVIFQGVETTAQRLIGGADQCLYEAKRLGRNRIVCVEPEFVWNIVESEPIPKTTATD